MRSSQRDFRKTGARQRAFAIAPWNFFDGPDAAAAAVHAPHGVQKEDEKPPHRNELEPPFGELVVAGCRLMAARTNHGGALARSHRDLDTLFVRTEPGVLVDKSPEAVAAV